MFLVFSTGEVNLKVSRLIPKLKTKIIFNQVNICLFFKFSYSDFLQKTYPRSLAISRKLALNFEVIFEKRVLKYAHCILKEH